MILAEEDLGLIRRGKRHFFLKKNPGWEPKRVVRLRKDGKDEGFVVTIVDVVERGEEFKVRFTWGDGRPEKRFIAEGWPDYTSDPLRAMPYEPPPLAETPHEAEERKSWLVLWLKDHREPTKEEKKLWRAPGVKARPGRVFCCVECERAAEGRSVFCETHRPTRSIRTYMPLDCI